MWYLAKLIPNGIVDNYKFNLCDDNTETVVINTSFEPCYSISDPPLGYTDFESADSKFHFCAQFFHH